MMNLELLYFATKVTGDSVYANIANAHAETTAKNQFRADYSNYHVVNYDELCLGTWTGMGYLRLYDGLS